MSTSCNPFVGTSCCRSSCRVLAQILAAVLLDRSCLHIQSYPWLSPVYIFPYSLAICIHTANEKNSRPTQTQTVVTNKDKNFRRGVITATFCPLHSIKAVQRKSASYLPLLYFIHSLLVRLTSEEFKNDECAGTEASTTWVTQAYSWASDICTPCVQACSLCLGVGIWHFIHI